MILIIECKTDDEPKYLVFTDEVAGRQYWEELRREFIEDEEGMNKFQCYLYSGVVGQELTEEASLVGCYA